MAHRLATAGWWATPIVAVQLSFVETRGDPRRPCDLDFVARSSQGKPLSFFPSCLPLSPEGNIFIFFSSHPTQSIEKAVVSSTGAGPPFPSHFFFYFFFSLSPHCDCARHSFAQLTQPCAIIEYPTSCFSSLSLGPSSSVWPPLHPHPHPSDHPRTHFTVARQTEIRPIRQWSLRRCRSLTR